MNKKIYSDLVREKISIILDAKDNSRILEAGCGSASHIEFPKNATVYGIDISSEQLDKNNYINERLLGDIQSYQLESDYYDLVVCSDVLEHLEHPMSALENLFRSTRKGGLVVLAFPNLISLKGLVTKLSPYWFHKIFYRYLNRTSNPFPTFFKMSIRPSNIVKYAKQQGYSIDLFMLYGIDESAKNQFRTMYKIIDVICSVMNIFSMLTIDFKKSECIMILRKP